MASKHQEKCDTQDGVVNHSNLLPDIIPTLPLETRWPPFPLRQYGGFWIPEGTLQVGLPALYMFFKPRPSDVFLASVPKSGTTWLKALTFATLYRSKHSPFDVAFHPLHHHNPHDCVPFFEPVERNRPNLIDELEAIPSPRVFTTHLPYSLLPDSIKDASSGSKIVYISREPKDVLVSSWFFYRRIAEAVGVVVDAQSFDFYEAFELFCKGHFTRGPQWCHVLEYWNESVRRPDKVLFLKYEEMLFDPKSNLKKLARFIGCEFSQEEDDRGVVDAIVELCSLDKLKNTEVNKHGRATSLNIRNEILFRKGVVGDWSNHMTPEMAKKLDNIVQDALEGSGFTFSSSLM